MYIYIPHKYVYIYIYIYIYIVYYYIYIYIHMNLYTLLYNDLHNPILQLYDISHRIGTQNDDIWAMALVTGHPLKLIPREAIRRTGRGTPNRCQSIATWRWRPGSGSGKPWGFWPFKPSSESLNVPIFHITQPLGIWAFLWLLFQVMSNIPKMGQLPSPFKHLECHSWRNVP